MVAFSAQHIRVHVKKTRIENQQLFLQEIHAKNGASKNVHRRDLACIAIKGLLEDIKAMWCVPLPMHTAWSGRARTKTGCSQHALKQLALMPGMVCSGQGLPA